MDDLEGKVAFVTGAGRREGLGRAIAIELARLGADVVVTDRLRAGSGYPQSAIADEAELNAVAGEIAELGRRSLAVRCDVTNAAEVEDAVAQTVGDMGRLDILVNNAGVGYLMARAVDLDESDWDTTIAVNLKGPFLCGREAARQMIKQGEGGRIITIASQAAKSGFPHALAYCASKHGVVGVTRVLALELGEHRITANAVCPNHVTTGLGAWQNEYFSSALGLSIEEYRDQMLSRIPLRRNATQQDIANVVGWLAGPESGYVTGEAINVSGGEEMH